ncbi:MAG TPA: hypothetical protein VLE43_00425, partial [Candidatus Saccharimonadia bacterium]|nr:hypothetical protein [Candidatus Saccharimonadia bacterium]
MIRSAKKKLLAALLALGVAASLATWVVASIGSFDTTLIDFTNPKEAAGKASWSDDLEAIAEGLKRKAPETLRDDSTITTEPVSLGVSWRPAAGARLRVVIEGIPTPQKRDDGAVVVPLSGTLFVRFGPDCSHWSGWQALAP